MLYNIGTYEGYEGEDHSEINFIWLKQNIIKYFLIKLLTIFFILLIVVLKLVIFNKKIIILSSINSRVYKLIKFELISFNKIFIYKH